VLAGEARGSARDQNFFGHQLPHAALHLGIAVPM